MFKRTEESERIFDALGSRTRRDILTLLSHGPQKVGALANQLPISRPAVSKHLRILEHAMLVQYHMQGASNLYQLNPAGLEEIRPILEQFWDQALMNFQQLAEQDKPPRPEMSKEKANE